jgi:hypothetical protein
LADLIERDGEEEAEALQANVPTKDEARRIAVDVAHLPQRQLASASDILTVPDRDRKFACKCGIRRRQLIQINAAKEPRDRRQEEAPYVTHHRRRSGKRGR